MLGFWAILSLRVSPCMCPEIHGGFGAVRCLPEGSRWVRVRTCKRQDQGRPEWMETGAYLEVQASKHGIVYGM